MDIYNLREFVVLSKLKKYSDAADELAVSEPTLSRHILALENELGVKLFERTSRNVEINAYGQKLLPYANQLITIEEKCRNDLKETKYRNNNTVQICSTYYINDLLVSFYQYDDSITVNPNEHVRGNLVEMLQKNSAEIAISIEEITNPEDEFVILPFETERHVAVLSEDHPLANRKTIRLSELANDKFISFKSNSFGDRGIKNLCRQAGFSPRIVLSADIGSNIVKYVANGIGVSLLLEKSISRKHPQGVRLIPLEDFSEVNITLFYLKHKKLSPAAKRFIDFAVRQWPEIRNMK